jgi:hypothetical protein
VTEQSPDQAPNSESERLRTPARRRVGRRAPPDKRDLPDGAWQTIAFIARLAYENRSFKPLYALFGTVAWLLGTTAVMVAAVVYLVTHGMHNVTPFLKLNTATAGVGMSGLGAVLTLVFRRARKRGAERKNKAAMADRAKARRHAGANRARSRSTVEGTVPGAPKASKDRVGEVTSEHDDGDADKDLEKGA